MGRFRSTGCRRISTSIGMFSSVVFVGLAAVSYATQPTGPEAEAQAALHAPF